MRGSVQPIAARLVQHPRQCFISLVVVLLDLGVLKTPSKWEIATHAAWEDIPYAQVFRPHFPSPLLLNYDACCCAVSCADAMQHGSEEAKCLTQAMETTLMSIAVVVVH